MAIGLFWNPQVDRELTEIIQKEKPDVAHFNNIYPLIGSTAYRVCNKFKIPIIQRVPSFRIICPKGTLYRNNKICELCIKKNFKYPSILFSCYHNSLITSLVFSLADLYHRIIKTYAFINIYIFQAKFIRDYFVSKGLIPMNKTEILPHFVPTFKATRTNKKLRRNYFIYVGRLSEEKGIIELLNIFKNLKNIKLVVVGDGPLRKEVEGFAKYENITIKGFLHRNETMKLMRSAIATIIPSQWYETGPLVLMESYSVGTPVIAPNFGVFKNQVIEGETGFFFKKGNFEELKKIIISIWNLDKAKVKYLCHRAYKEYNKKYTERRHLMRLKYFYKSIKK